ncbi:MAG: hypothetical protein CM15mP4_0100 [Candidatus Neomarinimicrobiota bacterium]|nr:MAG: hypothetical protein CM15mP4_0100 [Candidatus Neomarinimicrobiota bacterium]
MKHIKRFSKWENYSIPMIAYFFAKFFGILKIFLFWKKLTKENISGLNNGSPVASKFIDTTLVVCIFFWGFLNGDKFLKL